MSNISPILIILPVMAIMMILFIAVFSIIISYLISVYKLIEQMKNDDNELWVSLGKPAFFPFLHTTLDPFKGFTAQIRLSNWILKGGNGIKNEKTMNVYRKTKRLFNIAMIGFVSTFIIYTALTFLVLILIGNK